MRLCKINIITITKYITPEEMKASKTKKFGLLEAETVVHGKKIFIGTKAGYDLQVWYLTEDLNITCLGLTNKILNVLW